MMLQFVPSSRKRKVRDFYPLINFGNFQQYNQFCLFYQCNMMCKTELFWTLIYYTDMYAKVLFGKLLLQQHDIELTAAVSGGGEKDKPFLHELEVSISP